MTASSVEGIGAGSAQRSGLRGPSNGRNNFVPQVCPHIVAAGEVETGTTELPLTGFAAVTLPKALPTSSWDDYQIFVTPIFEAHAPTSWYVVKIVTQPIAIFVIVTDATQGQARLMYTVVTSGLGLDINTDNPDTP